MLKAIKMIIAQKCVEARRPLLATEFEVAQITGKNERQQIEEVAPLVLAGKVKIGETMNGIYYQLVEVLV